MGEHTKGPWKAGRPDMATIVEGFDAKYVYADKKTVAIATSVDVEDWDVVMANARLIAAAPDLLEACKNAEAFVIGWSAMYATDYGLTDKIGTTPDDWHPVHRETYKQLKAAIAKAEGAA